ncbi:hypothetical protein L218DRAFT_373267 [Marasmius fiardii PR-910]|nr:hypothetical protein L218DRAFT_373267 [Marasmius fiardii PR-910]
MDNYMLHFPSAHLPITSGFCFQTMIMAHILKQQTLCILKFIIARMYLLYTIPTVVLIIPSLPSPEHRTYCILYYCEM